MNRVFVDTSAVIALLVATDEFHQPDSRVGWAWPTFFHELGLNRGPCPPYKTA